jgi:hypothetical protein
LYRGFSQNHKTNGLHFCSPVVGRPWRIRTADQRIKSPLLYQAELTTQKR